MATSKYQNQTIQQTANDAFHQGVADIVKRNVQTGLSSGVPLPQLHNQFQTSIAPVTQQPIPQQIDYNAILNGLLQNSVKGMQYKPSGGDLLQTILTTVTGLPTPGYGRVAGRNAIRKQSMHDFISLMGIQEKMTGEERRQAGEQRKQSQSYVNMLSGLIDIAKKTGNNQLFNQLSQLTGSQPQSNGQESQVGSLLSAPQPGLISGSLQGQGQTGTEQMDMSQIPEMNPMYQKTTLGGLIKQQRAKDIGKKSLESDAAFNSVVHLNDNLIADIKSANLQQGQGGPLHGAIGDTLAFLNAPNTQSIRALPNTIRETSIAYARQLAGGAKGVATFFGSVLHSMPTNKWGYGQSATTLANMTLTAYAFKRAVDEAKLTKDQLENMSPQEAASMVTKGQKFVTPELRNTMLQAIADKYDKIQPSKVISDKGKLEEPEPNPFMQSIGLAPPKSANSRKPLTTDEITPDLHSALEAHGINNVKSIRRVK